jgi:threonyl-tRNA synthetase
MANHEVTEICVHCHQEYDVRLSNSCPVCHRPSKLLRAHPEKCGLRNTPQSALIAAGFSYEVDYDRDLSDFDNVKIETYTRKLTEELKVEVVFGYRAESSEAFKLLDNYVELVVDDTGVTLTISTFGDLLKFCDFLKKST